MIIEENTYTSSWAQQHNLLQNIVAIIEIIVLRYRYVEITSSEYSK